jgi:hypothetical protein
MDLSVPSFYTGPLSGQGKGKLPHGNTREGTPRIAMPGTSMATAKPFHQRIPDIPKTISTFGHGSATPFKTSQVLKAVTPSRTVKVHPIGQGVKRTRRVKSRR